MQAKGGSFAKDKDFYRFTLGRGEVIPAVEEAVASMKEGGIRRIVVPVELGYPNNDMNAQGPTPTTFSVSLPTYGYLCHGARTTHILCERSQRMCHPSCKVVPRTACPGSSMSTFAHDCRSYADTGDMLVRSCSSDLVC